ncbi:MAG: phage holin family protein, partial [Myxococcaceae bacterium]
ILSLPVTFLTLGLFALVINAVLLWVTGAVAGSLGLGLRVDGFLPAFLGALVIGITRAVLNTVVDRRGRR